MIRRAIKSFIDINIEYSIKYFNLFMPASDVGTPRRIVANFKEKENEIEKILTLNPELRSIFIELLKSCLEYSSDKNSWKNIANEFINKYDKND
ncbi:MAG: hypothetical protein JXL97_18840 [Bacteroidales bacterium]|nr:hypothetical protein [Bacteroidales bacterium]